MTRSVLVVGASSPVGDAITKCFASSGDVVVGASVQAHEHDGLAAHVEADCADARGAALTIRTVLDVTGRLDVVVLAAAVQSNVAITETTEEQWSASIDAILGTAFQICRLGLPHMGFGAAIVAVSSVNSHVVAPGLSAYSAAKAGLEGLVRQLALEFGPRGIRANAVVPGLIVDGDYDEELAEGSALRRPGRPSEIAEVVHFLAGEKASFVTGACLPVDGGLTIVNASISSRPRIRARWLGDE